MTGNNLKKEDLRQFNGTKAIYINPAVSFTYTDGIKYLCENANCFWLLDVIESYQNQLNGVFLQWWEVNVSQEGERRSCKIKCHDGRNNFFVEQNVEHTDFPLEKITLFLLNNTLLLPSEN